MKRQRKPFKFYVIIFVFSVILVAAYTIYMIAAQGSTIGEVYPLWFMPFIFTGFYYGSDALIDRISRKKKKVNYEANFLSAVSERMRNSEEFIVEEFRRLQINKTFQDDLKKAYNIYQNGETELYSIERLEKKYRKESLEKKAMKYVIEFLRENQEIPKTDYENSEK